MRLSTCFDAPSRNILVSSAPAARARRHVVRPGLCARQSREATGKRRWRAASRSPGSRTRETTGFVSPCSAATTLRTATSSRRQTVLRRIPRWSFQLVGGRRTASSVCASPGRKEPVHADGGANRRRYRRDEARSEIDIAFACAFSVASRPWPGISAVHVTPSRERKFDGRRGRVARATSSR